jgi:RNA polymerase sigma-70 factor, ECF subfamily
VVEPDVADLAAEFDRLRPYLLRVAYSHLGSISEAEDAVQDTWVRLQHWADGTIENLRAWCTTTISRVCLDVLTSARARRENYVGTWLPEPVVTETEAVGADPAESVTLDESVSMALLVVLESLTPAERCSFLLHDVFGYRFEEIADVVGREPAAARQLASRARRAVRAERPRHSVSADEQLTVVRAFMKATEWPRL